MKSILRNLVYLALLGFSAAQQQKSYKGYVVLRTERLSASQATELRNLELSHPEFDFWKSAQEGKSADVMASASKLPNLKNILNSQHINFTTMIEDVGMVIQEALMESGGRTDYSMNWEDYQSHATINAYLESLAEKYDFANTVSIGKSSEGRDMRVLQITKAGKGKPNVWIEAGIHAREWISVAVASYMINQILTDVSAAKYLDEINFHILPSFNPDGYEYSRNYDRMWRKSRSDLQGSQCKGVDLNRNFDHHFGESGVSFVKCTDIYPGPNPFSEVESRNVRDYVLGLSPAPILAQCFHSYGQMLLYPYGFDYGFYPDNVDEMRELGKAAAEALFQVHGTLFQTMNSAELYPASGAADDWYTEVLGSRFVYTSELRDSGRHGFVLPAKQIIPSGEEMWAAERVFLDKILALSE